MVVLSTVVSECAAAALDNLLFRIENPDPQPGDAFGQIVEVVGNRIVVGAPSKFGEFAFSGFAYIYDDQGNLVREIPAPDPVRGSNFGRRITGVGDKILISAPGVDVPIPDVPPAAVSAAGRVYVFDRDGNLEVRGPDHGYRRAPGNSVQHLGGDDRDLHPWRAGLVLSGRAQQRLVRGFLRQRQRWNAQTTGRLGVLFAECGNLRVGHVIHRRQRNIHGG